MKICFQLILLSTCILSCSYSNIMDKYQYIEMHEAMESYRKRNGEFPKNENLLFFQEIMPYLGNIKLFNNNVEIMFVNFNSYEDTLNSQRVPLYIFLTNDGNAVKYIKKGKDGFDFVVDAKRRLDESQLNGKLLILPESGSGSTVLHDTTNFEYYYEQQLFYLKESTKYIVNDLENYKKHNKVYPDCCGKYFINYLIPYLEGEVNKALLEYDFLTLGYGSKIPIFKTGNSNKHFPFLSYCFNKSKNNYILYFTGRNRIDEMGLGDDEIMR